MSMLSVKNLDEKAFNYAVITVTPEAQVTLRGVFYVWCDVICIEPVNFIWGGDNPTLPAPIETNEVA